MSLLLALSGVIASAETHSVGFSGRNTEVNEYSNPFPTVPLQHKHARALLENALKFISDDTVDPVSGYITEGWNNDHKASLRGFTQLTSIGEWIEILVEAVKGNIQSPYLTKKRALQLLEKVTQSLLKDQKDPNISRKGLLVNFMLLKPEGRLATPTNELEKSQFVKIFGTDKANAIWRALIQKNWIKEINFGHDGIINRQEHIHEEAFDGALKEFSDPLTRKKIMDLFNQRVIAVVFGDNANLSTSIGKAIGALSESRLQQNAALRNISQGLETFLDRQKHGYADLFDADKGLFKFGRETFVGSEFGPERLIGSRLPDGNRKAMYSDYLVNEFRGPTAFVIQRFGFSNAPLKNMGVRVKPYTMQDGRIIYTLAPWDGSAFQGLGLTLSMNEFQNPSFRRTLRDFVAIEDDHSRRMGFPGLATESYRDFNDYTGRQGIPAIAADPAGEGTHTPALYSLGPAYQVDPDRMEKFLKDNWNTIGGKLLTDHGPWEGLNIQTGQPVSIQTSAHTFSLGLGLVGTGLDNMNQYLKGKGLLPNSSKVYPVGSAQNWSANELEIQNDRTVLRPKTRENISLSGGTFELNYRSTTPIKGKTIQLISGRGGDLLPKEIFLDLPSTNGKEEKVTIPLPSTPAFTDLSEVRVEISPRDLQILGARFQPTAN